MVITVNADKRYYIDEESEKNADSLKETMSKFNDAKMELYNILYEKKYHDTGDLKKMTYSAWLKKHFNLNDYYNCAIYTAAGGQVTSQHELHKLYQSTKQADIKVRQDKIKKTKEELEKKQAIKASIRKYAKTGHWKKPYPKCTLKVAGRYVHLNKKKTVPIDEYERTVEKIIRRCKNKIAGLEYGLQRMEKKLKDLKDHPPKKIVFGTRKRYRQKDTFGVDKKEWKESFSFERHKSMSLPGRHTSKNCNFLVRKQGNDLIVRCMDGKEAVFRDFSLARYQAEYLGMLSAPIANRKAICYNFVLHKDAKGREYLIVSVSMDLEEEYKNYSFSDGCIAIDLNYDSIAVSDISADGTRLGGKVFWFEDPKRRPELKEEPDLDQKQDPKKKKQEYIRHRCLFEDKTSGQITDIIGRTMAKVGKYCADRKKPLVMEDIELTIKRHSLRYGPKKRNRYVSMFAYRKMTACLYNQAYKQKFAIYLIDPAYTSQIGKFLYMRKMGISIHEAASYVIGLKGMHVLERLLPEKEMMPPLKNALSDSLIESYKESMGSDAMYFLMKIWHIIYKKFQGIPTHLFYQKIPYDALQEPTKKGNKRKPTLSFLATKMKEWMPPAFSD